MRVRLRGLRLRRGKWPVVDPLRDFRQCPECGHLVCSWSGQWIAQEWHADQIGEDDEHEHELDGYVVGQGMAPADVMTGDDGGE